jgi:lauroyl/myristoyl acyltransferase
MPGRRVPAAPASPIRTRLAWPVALLYGSLRAIGILPLPVLHGIGAAIGHVIWLVHGRARRIAERNLTKV